MATKEISTVSALGTATSSDSILVVDASEATGSKLKRTVFSGNSSQYLNGAGGWGTPAGYTNLTSFVAQTAYRLFYSNTDGDVTELALGADGDVLQSNGPSVAPTWETPSAGGSTTVTTVSAATKTLGTGDDILHVTYTATGACTVTWPTAQIVSGRVIRVKDAGGDCSTNNITVATEGSQTIDGEASYVMTQDYSAITIYCDGSNLFIA